jgi:hypothetical protein
MLTETIVLAVRRPTMTCDPLSKLSSNISAVSRPALM